MIDLLGIFSPQSPYDFHKTARAARFYATLGVEQDGAYWRALRIGDGVALVRVVSRGTVHAPLLEAHLMAASGHVEPDAVRAKVAHMLHLTSDMQPFYTLAHDDGALWRIVEPLVGLHSFLADSLFEALCVTVIEQQITLSAAQKGERWLAAWAGDSIQYDGMAFYAFPTPERIAVCTVDELTPLKITFQRMQRLIDIARLHVDGQIHLESLRHGSPDAAYAALVNLKGVGHWTAAWTLTRALGHYLYVGSADVALRAAVNTYFDGQPGRAERSRTDEIFTRYGDFAGLACFHTLMRYAMDRY